jgi:pyridoxal phosphate enzyme (YggS family)
MLTGPQKSAAISNTGLVRTRERIRAAALASGRDPGTVTLLAVSKGHSAEMIRSAHALGQRHFGESYLKEALAKMDVLSDLEITWHFIGRLQGNKTREVATHFDWVHTIDRERVARRLDEQRPHYAAPLDVCIQINLDAEPAKGGTTLDAMADLAAVIERLPRLRLRGLMCIPRERDAFDAQRAAFERLTEALRSLVDLGHPVDTLSMGMSADLEAAIAAGATTVRVGTAVFGERGPG